MQGRREVPVPNEDTVVLQPVGLFVVVPLREPVGQGVIHELANKLLDYLHSHGARGVVLDMTGVEILDAYDFEALRSVVQAAGIMGATVVLAGLRPGVAAGLAMLNVDGSWVTATRTVDQALELLS